MNKRVVRYVLVGAAAVAVSFPLIGQILKGQDAPPGPLVRVAPATAPAVKVDPKKVIVSAGDLSITAREFDDVIGELSAADQTQLRTHPIARQRLAEDLLKIKILAAEARKRKLADTPKGRFAMDQVLAQLTMQDVAAQDGADEKFYNDNKDYFDELKVRHILVATAGAVPGSTLTDPQAKAKADGLKQRLDKGEDFAKMARESSDDKSSGPQGGDLNQPVAHGAPLVEPFITAAFTLKKGEISQPVKSEFGYHIIQVTDKTSPAFQQARQRVAQRRIEVLLDDLKKQANPHFDEEFFGTTPPATQPATGPQTK